MIHITNASFRYEGATQNSVSDLDFSVQRGECVLITGSSGCGKSTLLRMINGLIPNYYGGGLSGRIEVDGIEPAEVPLYDQAGKTSTILQNPKSQFYTTDTVSELAFALENQGMPEAEIVSRIERTVNQLSISGLMGRSLFALSGGEKQRIACACANVADTDLILMDEPTANLDYEASGQLREMIRYWKSKGKSILIAEHRIAWILDTVTRLVVMQKGRIVFDEKPDGTEIAGDHSEIIRRYDLRTPVCENPLDIDLPVFGGEEVDSLEINQMRFSYDGKHTVLDIGRIPIAAHKVTAVVGANGKGKTTFLRCLCGLEKRDKSFVRVHGENWNRKMRQKKIYLITQDVNAQLFTQEVREEIAISLPEALQRDPAAAEKRIEDIAGRLDLTDLLDCDPASLSGGQKQRTAIAGAIASEREILLFDEPTSGLDLTHMREIAALLREEANNGKTILVVTHDDELIYACADYKIVL